MEFENKSGVERKASTVTNLFGGAMHYKKSHDWAAWVCGFLFFNEDIGMDTIEKVTRERILAIPRFRSRYDHKKGKFIEIDIEKEFDMDYHLRVVNEPMELQEVRDEYCGDVYKHMNFDKDKPLWQYTYFPKLADGRSLLFTNIAHTVGDGVSQIEILYTLLDEPEDGSKLTKEETIQSLRPSEKRKAPKGSYGPLNRARIVVGGAIGAFFDVFGSADTKNPLTKTNSKETGLKKTGFTEQIDFSKVKALKEKYGGATINDLLVALLTLTINAYFNELEEKEGAKIVKKRAKIRAGFPISTRKKGEHAFRDGSPHNKIAQGLLKFYVKPDSPTDLVWKVKRQLDKIKLSPGPLVQHKIATTVLPLLPKSIGTKLFIDFANASTAQLSNVAGPRETASFAGHEVADIEFLLSEPIGCYFGLLSYNGKISCGICMDENTIGLPEEIAKHWKPQFDILYEESMAFDGPVPRPKKKIQNFLDSL